jgi:adenine-specific DNA-methyltransferase
LIRYLCQRVSDSGNIILDFFSGSATTAHAVMQLNAEDGGKRRFIMVQLLEVCAEDSEAAKAGYATICEIGKERIRRAGDLITAKDAKDTKNEQQDVFRGSKELDIAKRQPLRAVFRDSSFTSSPEKINVTEIFKLLAPNTTVKVI